VHHACICIITNTMHCSSSVYWVYHTATCFGRISSPSSGGRMYRIYEYVANVADGTCYAAELTVSGSGWNRTDFRFTQDRWQWTWKCHMPHLHIIPPDDKLLTCPKLVEVSWFNKLRINSALSWLLYIQFIMYGQPNVTKKEESLYVKLLTCWEFNLRQFRTPRFFFLSVPLHVPYRPPRLPSRLWPKWNRLLRLGRPWDAVSLSRRYGWWYMNMKCQEGP
jgi:hypothetical protein